MCARALVYDNKGPYYIMFLLFPGVGHLSIIHLRCLLQMICSLQVRLCDMIEIAWRSFDIQIMINVVSRTLQILGCISSRWLFASTPADVLLVLWTMSEFRTVLSISLYLCCSPS